MKKTKSWTVTFGPLYGKEGDAIVVTTRSHMTFRATTVDVPVMRSAQPMAEVKTLTVAGQRRRVKFKEGVASISVPVALGAPIAVGVEFKRQGMLYVHIKGEVDIS